MREIKFRTWNKDIGEMIPWNRLLNRYNLQNVFMSPEMCGLILMQYTGLKDKDGVEIYEGDIVEAYFWNDKLKPVKEKGFIELQSGSFMFNFGGETWEYLDGSVNTFVIGNIYENKNLLEEEGC